METVRVSASDFKRNSGALLNKVRNSHTRVVIAKRGIEVAVLTSLSTKSSNIDLAAYRGSMPGLAKEVGNVRDALETEFSSRIP